MAKNVQRETRFSHLSALGNNLGANLVGVNDLKERVILEKIFQVCW